MITIDQLLESVDLDFEPRWVTQDAAKHIEFWSEKPKAGIGSWRFDVEGTILSSIDVRLKLAEFENKHWTECIYEVPRKTTEKIERLETNAGYMQLSSSSMNKNQTIADMIMEKINELVDAVNELKGAKNE